MTATSAVRRAGPLALAGLVAQGTGLLVTVLVAHLLTEREYGAVGQLVGLFLVLAIPGSAVLVAVVQRVVSWRSAGLEHEVSPWVARVRHRGYGALALFGIGAFALRGWMAGRLSLPSPAGVAEILTAGAAWALLAVDRGLIQARRAYRALARNLGVEAAARAAVTLPLVAAGAGVEGVALGLVAAVVAADLDARLSLVRHPGPEEGLATPEVTAMAEGPLAPVAPVGGRRRLGLDLVTALGALGFIALLQNADVVIVGRLSPSRSGQYVAISVSAKALVFAAIVLSGYLLPEAAIRWHRGEHALRQLAVALGLIAVPSAGLVAVAALAPRLLLRLVFGAHLVGAAPAFAPLSLAMAFLASTVLFSHYLLGIGRRRVVLLLGLGAAVTLPALAAAHGDPVTTARVQLACQLLLAAATGGLVWNAHR